MYPIVIQLPQGFATELSECELGSYEDMQEYADKGEEVDRPLVTHTHIVAKRFKSKLVINNVEEAEDVYYSVCSGTFQSLSKRAFIAACKVADALRDNVRQCNPTLVAQWPKPWDNQ